ncbi:hypothetical protein [Pseudomonas sp. HLMP]|uniref:hypothetical protein n=1 Tax=Pseudomonas sp. HLMP TaxID=3153767 RepID=UPI0039675180
MQPQHYILAMGVLWLFTLATLPYLFALTRRRAYDDGYNAGFAEHQRMFNSYSAALNNDITHLATAREEDQRKHQQALAALKATIAELEARIMSYTGMPVTRADYDLLSSAAETLRLAEKTWKAARGTEPWRNRATRQMQDIQALAMRVHSQLRSTPASASTAGEAA